MLRLEALTRHFGDSVAVDGVTLEVQRGEFLTLLGPSGCGKTTTLRMIAGFERPTSGRVLLNDRDVTALPPQQRGIGMVFQSYALFPHLDVHGNVEFGLRSRGERGPHAAEKVERALRMVELEGFGRRKVQGLSGGQQQRVALARALAPEPPLLLLDEPLSNLDAALRERTRDELRALLKRLEMTTIFVTHDQEEAFALSDRIAFIDRGCVQQVSSPELLYAAPATPFVASFVGRATFLAASVEGAYGATVTCSLQEGPVWPARWVEGAQLGAGAAVQLMVRPEGLRMVMPGTREGALSGTVLERRFAGPVSFYRIGTARGAELTVQSGTPLAAVGDAVDVVLAEGAIPVAFASALR